MSAKQFYTIITIAALSIFKIQAQDFTNFMADTIDGFKIQVNVPELSFNDLVDNRYAKVDKEKLVKELNFKPITLKHHCNSEAENKTIDSLLASFNSVKTLISYALEHTVEESLRILSSKYDNPEELRNSYPVATAFEGINEEKLKDCYNPDVIISIDTSLKITKKNYNVGISFRFKNGTDTTYLFQSTITSHSGDDLGILRDALFFCIDRLVSNLDGRHPTSHRKRYYSQRRQVILEQNRKTLFASPLPMSLKKEISKYFSKKDNYRVASVFADPDKTIYKGILIKELKGTKNDIFQIARNDTINQTRLRVEQTPIHFYALKIGTNWYINYTILHTTVTKGNVDKQEEKYYGYYLYSYRDIFFEDDTTINLNFLRKDYWFRKNDAKTPIIIDAYENFKLSQNVNKKAQKLYKKVYTDLINPLRQEATYWKDTDSLGRTYIDRNRELEEIFFTPNLNHVIFPLLVFQNGKKVYRLFVYDLNLKKTFELLHFDMNSPDDLLKYCNWGKLSEKQKLWPFKIINDKQIFKSIITKKDKYGEFVFLFEIDL